MHRRAKILHVITGLGTGGAELMLASLLEQADRGRFEPSVLSLMGPGDLTRRIEALGIPLPYARSGSGDGESQRADEARERLQIDCA